MAEKEEEEQTSGNQIYYLLGAAVFVAIVVAGYLLRSKTNLLPTTVAPSPAPNTPITGLVCENKYYNPVIGFPKYYLSVEGGDVSAASKVTCETTVSVTDRLTATTKVVATESAESPLTPAPQRNGATFRCTTKAIALTPDVATKVDYFIKDDLGKTATCSTYFVFPKP